MILFRRPWMVHLAAKRTAGDDPGPGAAEPAEARPAWTFLTNHGHVLLAVATQPDLTVAGLADRIGISTRATLSILKDLEQEGYLERTRVGRRTQYRIDVHRHFRHRLAAAHEIGELLDIFTPRDAGGEPAPGRGHDGGSR